MTTDVRFSEEGLSVTSGRDDTDDGIKLRVAGEAFPRLHFTPQGLILVGNGTVAPTPLDGERTTVVAPLVLNGAQISIPAATASVPGYATAAQIQQLNAATTYNAVHGAIGKTANEQYSSLATLQDDDDLAWVLGPNESSSFFSLVFAQGPTAGDIAFGINGPAGSSVTAGIIGPISTIGASPSNEQYQGTISTITAVGATGTGTIGVQSAVPTPIIISGRVYTGATGGTFRLQHCQAVSNATPTIVLAASTLRYDKV